MGFILTGVAYNLGNTTEATKPREPIDRIGSIGEDRGGEQREVEIEVEVRRQVGEMYPR